MSECEKMNDQLKEVSNKILQTLFWLLLFMRFCLKWV